jgi:hypothetical protein
MSALAGKCTNRNCLEQNRTPGEKDGIKTPVFSLLRTGGTARRSGTGIAVRAYRVWPEEIHSGNSGSMVLILQRREKSIPALKGIGGRYRDESSVLFKDQEKGSSTVS